MKFTQFEWAQVEKIYREHLVFDFPSDEVKPLEMMFKAMERGMYQCYGLVDEDTVLGYAFFVKNDRYFLLDYLAVVRGRRDEGLGSILLGEIAKRFSDSDGVLIEIENPAFAATQKEMQLQIRRRNFYLKNACVDSGVDVTAAGVPFRLLELAPCGVHSASELRKRYRALYQQILPPWLWERIEIPQAQTEL